MNACSLLLAHRGKAQIPWDAGLTGVEHLMFVLWSVFARSDRPLPGSMLAWNGFFVALFRIDDWGSTTVKPLWKASTS